MRARSRSGATDGHRPRRRRTGRGRSCGCGNFLVIACRELRRLELEVIREILERNEAGMIAGRMDVGSLSRLDMDQFYGIEIGEFPARIAEVALWMTDHLMNNELSLEFGQSTPVFR